MAIGYMEGSKKAEKGKQRQINFKSHFKNLINNL